MLAFDSQRLDRKHANPYLKHYQECSELVKELGRYVEFEVVSRMGPREFKEAKISPDFTPKANILLSSRYVCAAANIDTFVTFFANSKPLPNGMEAYYPSHQRLKGKLVLSTVDNRDMDLIFFLLFVSPSCELVVYENEPLAEQIRTKQNSLRTIGRPKFHLRVGLFEARKQMRNAQALTKVANMLTSETRKVDDRVVLDWMYSLNLQVDKLNPEINRAKLFQHMMTTSAGTPNYGLIEKFIGEDGLVQVSKYTGLVNKALDNEVLKLVDPQPGKDGSFLFKDQEGNFKNILTSIRYGSGNAKVFLAEELSKDSKLTKLLENLLKDAVPAEVK